MFKKWIRRNIEEFIAWYIFRYGHGALKLHRKGGAIQIARIFSEQANEKIVQPAFDCNGIFYTQEQLNRAIKETIKAVRNCGEDSDCWECYLHIKEDGCAMDHVDNDLTEV